MDRPLRNLLLVFAGLFLALIVNLTYVQVYAAPRLETSPSNTRGIQEQMRVERGLILSADGVELAGNRQVGDLYRRTYPLGDLVEPVLGYNDLRYGRAGLERLYNPELSGDSPLLGIRSALDQALGRPKRGADVVLTLDIKVQRAAVEALDGHKGAIVVIDPKTGAIIALASSPRYDPSQLGAQWKALNADPDRPLLNRPTQGLYPPGSAFKPVVAAKGLATGAVAPDTSFDDSGAYRAGGYVVRNYGDKAYGHHTFAEAMAQSINTTFAKLGVQLGGASVAESARAFGFDRDLPGRLSAARSRFPDPAKMDTAHVAQASFGQGEVLATPLEMALVASGIANGGKIMAPFLVSEVRDYQQTVLQKTQPREWLQAADPATAATVRDLMVGVVTEGTGKKAAIDGVQVAGKTGTAELDKGEPHAWFIGFAPADDPRVAVAVIVENGGTGGSVAAPMAAQVMRAALQR